MLTSLFGGLTVYNLQTPGISFVIFGEDET